MDKTAQKEIGLVLATSVFSVLELVLFYFLLRAATGNWMTAAVVLVVSVVWLVLLAVSLAVARHPLSVVALIVVPVLVILGVSRLSAVAIGGAALLGIFLLLAQRTFVREMRDRLQYRTVAVFGAGLRLLTLGCLVGLLGLGWTTLVGEDGVYQLHVTEERLAPLLKPLEPLVRRFIPNFRSELSVDELILQELDTQTAQLPPGVSIPPDQLAQSRAQLSQRFGEQLRGDETLTTLVTRRLNRYIEALTEENVALVTLVLIAIAFLTLRALVPFIVWPLLGLVALMVAALRAIGLLELREEQVIMQRLAL